MLERDAIPVRSVTLYDLQASACLQARHGSLAARCHGRASSLHLYAAGIATAARWDEARDEGFEACVQSRWHRERHFAPSTRSTNKYFNIRSNIFPVYRVSVCSYIGFPAPSPSPTLGIKSCKYASPHTKAPSRGGRARLRFSAL